MADLTKDGGRMKAFEVEELRGPKQGEMHQTLLQYFCNVEIKPSGSYKIFLVRVFSTKVIAWFILRKLELDTTAEL